MKNNLVNGLYQSSPGRREANTVVVIKPDKRVNKEIKEEIEQTKKLGLTGL